MHLGMGETVHSDQPDPLNIIGYTECHNEYFHFLNYGKIILIW